MRQVGRSADRYDLLLSRVSTRPGVSGVETARLGLSRHRHQPRAEAALPFLMRFENPATGEVIEVESECPELLVMRATWTRPGQRAVTHAHPGMQERWEVLEGQAAFNIDGTVTNLGPGESIVAEPGQRHLAWNPTAEKVVLRIEMRPALRWCEFVERLFAGEPVGSLVSEFADEIRIG